MNIFAGDDIEKKQYVTSAGLMTSAFSTFITTGTTSVVLPSTLSGEYRLEIVKGNITFYCYIEL